MKWKTSCFRFHEIGKMAIKCLTERQVKDQALQSVGAVTKAHIPLRNIRVSTRCRQTRSFTHFCAACVAECGSPGQNWRHCTSARERSNSPAGEYRAHEQQAWEYQCPNFSSSDGPRPCRHWTSFGGSCHLANHHAKVYIIRPWANPSC